ncbi:hypothetical protein MTO96_012736 [Rhipicephalus appendiculatus]
MRKRGERGKRGEVEKEFSGQTRSATTYKEARASGVLTADTRLERMGPRKERRDKKMKGKTYDYAEKMREEGEDEDET